MLAGITKLIFEVDVSPFEVKYYFTEVARQAVIRSLIVIFHALAAALTSSNLNSLLD